MRSDRYFDLVFGLFVGAVLVSFTTWPWVFYFIAIAAVLTAVLAFICVPNLAEENAQVHPVKKFKRLDLVGVTILTSEVSCLRIYSR